MNRLLIPLFLLLPFLSPGQRVIETFYDFGWRQTSPENASFYAVVKRTDSGWYRQVEYIHSNSYFSQGLYQDAECTIEHGYDHMYYPNGNLRAFGKFTRGVRTGLWRTYYENGTPMDSVVYRNGKPQISKTWFPNGVLKDSMVLDEDGNGDFISWYDNGQLSSIGKVAMFENHADQWKYFHKNGKLGAYITYKYRTDRIIDSRYYDETGKMGRAQKDRGAIFPGRANAWNEYLEKNVQMPDRFRLEGGSSATVVIHAYINTEGKIASAYVKVPLHPVFDSAVLNAVNASPAWIPAIHHNRKIYHEIDVPFTFIQKHRPR